jgi:hypothetical protein
MAIGVTAFQEPWQENENKMIVPKAARAAMGPHVWVPSNGTEPGHYERRPYVFAEYPKMLYHPKYGKQPKPVINDFENTPKFLLAMREWEQSDSVRTVTAENAKHEEALLKKGWMLEPPAAKVERKKDVEEL